MEPLDLYELVDTKQVFHRVHSAICDLALDLYGRPDGDWTVGVKKRLKEIGSELGFKTWGGVSNAEWLLDLIWVDDDVYDGKESEEKRWWHNFNGLKLACEIEWKGDEYNLMHDFMKLVVIKSNIKMFIYETKAKNNEKLYDEFRNFVKYTNPFPNDYYIVIAIPPTGERCRNLISKSPKANGDAQEEVYLDYQFPYIHWHSGNPPQVFGVIDSFANEIEA